MPITRSRRRTWAALAAVVAALAACGSPGNVGTASKTAGVHVPENFCGLLSGSEISRVVGRAFPAPEGSQSPSEAQCAAIPTAGNDVTFKLYWNNLYCVEGKPADGQCLNAQSKGFLANKQTAGKVQDVSGLGDRAFCFVAPPATLDVLKGWIYLIVSADNCAQAQTLAGMVLAKVEA
ncbi:hypothetical protein GCM10009641_39760 [Mycobacterium cookii]|uniref:DUF3558 domain-containing protein n=1 Tax=Mycobacterium cookii TaxID=1775 RepID=A0A7I7KZW4_9MYCO|nr:hypothetical protein [Mycobacterium cookii]MCV7331579.1 hypothetical protein [Mycobacterium cookii]BBX46872.1 hypothetical protein MCOO_28870 [Mycobacterium cookii]